MSTDLSVGLEQTDGKGKAYIGESRSPLAKMTFSLAGRELIIIDHTEVNGSLRGKGAGKAMLERIVELTRAQGMKVMPLCPFAKATFIKNKHLQDVLHT